LSLQPHFSENCRRQVGFPARHVTPPPIISHHKSEMQDSPVPSLLFPPFSYSLGGMQLNHSSNCSAGRYPPPWFGHLLFVLSALLTRTTRRQACKTQLGGPGTSPPVRFPSHLFDVFSLPSPLKPVLSEPGNLGGITRFFLLLCLTGSITCSNNRFFVFLFLPANLTLRD